MISIEDFKKITEYLFEWCSPTGFSKEWSRKEDKRIEKFRERVILTARFFYSSSCHGYS